MNTPRRLVGYHGTEPEDLGSVLAEGLLRSRNSSTQGCQHGGCTSIAESLEIARAFGEVILVVDLDGLAGLSPFYGGEARVHGDIAAERISVYDGPLIALSRVGHVDPGKTPLGQHPACVHPSRLQDFDLSTYRELPTKREARVEPDADGTTA